MSLYESPWVRMSQNESRWVNMSQKKSKWVEMSQNESKWVRMSQNELKWVKISQNEAKWVKMTKTSLHKSSSSLHKLPIMTWIVWENIHRYEWTSINNCVIFLPLKITLPKSCVRPKFNVFKSCGKLLLAMQNMLNWAGIKFLCKVNERLQNKTPWLTWTPSKQIFS